MDQEYIDLFGDGDYEDVINVVDNGLVDPEPESVDICTHDLYTEEDGMRICLKCGIKTGIIDYEPEWRSYITSENSGNKDNSRCHAYKQVEKGNIDKIFTDYSLEYSEAVRKKVKEKYNKVVDGKTLRNKGRISLVANCLHYTLMDIGEIKIPEDIGKMFNLTDKEFSEGQARFLEKFPEYRDRYIRPRDLLKGLMRMVGVDVSHYSKIDRLAIFLEDATPVLKHSKTKSIAASVIYLYLMLHKEYKDKLGITKTTFSNKVDLSEVTISKLVKDAYTYIQTAIKNQI